MNRIKYLALLLSLILFQSCENMKKPLVIGHRGAMGHETENTLASIQKAMDLGVDMIEIDVFKIASGETVVFHDDRVDRLTNGGGNIEEYVITDLKALTLDGNHKIPQLQDVLKLIDHKVKLNIELKGADTANRVNFITNYYIREKGWKLNDFLISSFRWDELKEMRALNPEIPIAILTEDDPLKGIPIAKELHAEAINPNFKELNDGIAQEIHNEGFKIYTWTVNEPGDIEMAKNWNVDGIITNFPERVK